MLKLNDFNKVRKNRHEAWIKECVEEKQGLLKRIDEIDETILDYRMRRRSDLNRMVCENISFNHFIEIIENEKTRNRNQGLYWIKENTVFVGMDNTTGEAWVEEFNTFKECINWLFGY